MNPNLIADKIKSDAIELGFNLVGFVKPKSPDSFDKYSSWIENNFHGEMEYLSTDRAHERRKNPNLILENCKSILVLGVSYSKPQPDYANPIIDNTNIASYAWNLDYHEALKPMVENLLKIVEKYLGYLPSHKWYSDTGPILERDLASSAGLGWFGKNSMLINPKIGSTFIITEILLDVDLSKNEKIITDHCGNCTRCIDACPTECIMPNRTIDATKCISYFTIELKGEIPTEFRNHIGDWGFGCDICQQVCPWNLKFAPDIGLNIFNRERTFNRSTIKEVFNFNPQEFNKFFKNSPIKRSKRRGLLRNLAVVLGNQKNEEDIPILVEALSHDEPLVRQHVAWALGEFQLEICSNALRNRLEIEENASVIQEINLSLQ